MWTDDEWDNVLSNETRKLELMKFKPKWNRDDSKPLFVHPDPRAVSTMSTYWDPFDSSKEHPIVSCFGPYVFNSEQDVNRYREDLEYNTDTEDYDESMQQGRVAYVPPGIFGFDGKEKLTAFRLCVPGYREKQWVTVLPKPTSFYERTVDVQFHGDTTNCHPRENYLTQMEKVDNGRTFISFPNGPQDVLEMAKNTSKGCSIVRVAQGSGVSQARFDEGAQNWMMFVNSGTIDYIVSSGDASFWIVLTNTRRSGFAAPMSRVFTYTMRMDPIKQKEYDDGVRPTAYGSKRPKKDENDSFEYDENDKPIILEYEHDIIDLRELNSIE